MTDSVMYIFQRAMFVAADLGISMPGNGGGGGNGGAANVVANGAPLPPPAAAPADGGQMWPMLAVWVLVIAGMWFLMIRPQRKREKQMKEMQQQISAGDNVLVSNGMFGKIAEVGEDCFIIEFGTNKGLRIPVLKGDVVGIREPKITPQPKDAD